MQLPTLPRMPRLNNTGNPIWKAILIGMFISVAFLFISVATMNDYGETTDEKPSQISGSYYYYQWDKQKSVQDYVQAFSVKDRNYGPFIDTLSVASHDFFTLKHHIITNPVASYHVPAIIASTLCIFVVYLFAYVTWGTVPAIMAAITLALMPRFIGDSQNNIKDTPIMTLFAMTFTCYYLAFVKRKLRYYVVAGVFLGMTYATKINALIIFPSVLLWVGLVNGRSLKDGVRNMVGLGLSLCSAFIAILVFWPYYRYNPLERFVETYGVFRNHEWDLYTLYLGQHYRGHEVPRHYPFVMLGVTTPTWILILLALAVAIIIGMLIRRTDKRSLPALLLTCIWMLATPVTQALSPNPMYDGIRHYQASLAPMAILAGFAVWYIGKMLYTFRKAAFIVFMLVCVWGYGSILYKDITMHPYQIVYFNELVGGVRGAYGKFDLDYWGQSLLEASRWINTNLPTGARIWSTNHNEHHFPIDQSRFTFVSRYPQYKVNLIRGILYEWDTDDSYLHPRRKPIYEITVDGAPILQVFPIQENMPAADNALPPIPLKGIALRPGLQKTVYPNAAHELPATITEMDSNMHIACPGDDYGDVSSSTLYEGYLSVPKAGEYCFRVESDDDGILRLNDKLIISNAWKKTSERKIHLETGLYRFSIEHTNEWGNACLVVQWALHGCGAFEDIPEKYLFHE